MWAGGDGLAEGLVGYYVGGMRRLFGDDARTGDLFEEAQDDGGTEENVDANVEIGFVEHWQHD